MITMVDTAIQDTELLGLLKRFTCNFHVDARVCLFKNTGKRPLTKPGLAKSDQKQLELSYPVRLHPLLGERILRWCFRVTEVISVCTDVEFVNLTLAEHP